VRVPSRKRYSSFLLPQIETWVEFFLGANELGANLYFQ
jgi:hypothetical protein